MAPHGNHHHKPFNFILWLNIFFIIALIVILALIPVTGGKSLMAVIPWFVAVCLYGLIYVMFSSTKPPH